MAKAMLIMDMPNVCYDCHFGLQESRTKEEAIKKWNTRKPMERIIERLKENSNFLLHEMEDSKMYAGNESAIEIVKEEGGTSD